MAIAVEKFTAPPCPVCGSVGPGVLVKTGWGGIAFLLAVVALVPGVWYGVVTGNSPDWIIPTLIAAIPLALHLLFRPAVIVVCPTCGARRGQRG